MDFAEVEPFQNFDDPICFEIYVMKQLDAGTGQANVLLSRLGASRLLASTYIALAFTTY